MTGIALAEPLAETAEAARHGHGGARRQAGFGLESEAERCRAPHRATAGLGTKAQTLEWLKPLLRKSSVLDLCWFTVAEWQADPLAVIQRIETAFKGRRLVFRSSACGEDGQVESQAGAYKSCLNVEANKPQEVGRAIAQVVASYHGNPDDQVLVQPMLEDVQLSGVIMTHDLDTGAPYYTLNYDDESGKTDTITGGTGVNKTVMVHRDFIPSYVESPRVAELLEMARELEGLCGGHEALDIEFAKTKDGCLYLLQTRRIAVKRLWNRRIATRVSEGLYNLERYFAERSQPRSGLAGAHTILGQMPDWNPAEIIGTRPRPLAVSLYRELITDAAWREARESMGYRRLPAVPLMVMLGGVPFIDVRHSFNSFLPDGLPAALEHRLLDAWLARLNAHPEFHDKVEFQVAQTVVDFTFDQQFQQRYDGVLSPDEFLIYRDKLLALTRRNVDMSPDASLRRAVTHSDCLECLQRSWPPVGERRQLPRLPALLAECRELGTRPFSVIARHAFIAEAFLRSAVARGALNPERIDDLKRSLDSVTARFTREFTETLAGRLDRRFFLERYGHLRPGTYDILSLRYDQRQDLFDVEQVPAPAGDAPPFQLTAQEESALARLFAEVGLPQVLPAMFVEYARLAMSQREQAKFVFTRHLSEALELIATWGQTAGLDRNSLSYLALADILQPLDQPVLEDPAYYYQELVKQRQLAAEAHGGIRLGYLIRDLRDFYVVPLHRSAPNFVSAKRVEAQTVQLDHRSTGQVDLAGRIVCIENADPGFDWIFTRGIAGLISKFGGANSHMTIRCAELSLPAAIGVGEQTFERAITARRVELNCGAKIIRPFYH